MPGSRTVAIVNPAAGGDRGAAAWETVETDLLTMGERWDSLFSEELWHAARLAQGAVDGGAERIVTIGGDGTVNEVVNGIARSKTGLAGTTLGIVPIGRGNDFVKQLGAPVGRPLESLRRIRTLEPRAVDVGCAGRRYFVNGLGLGVDGYVVVATKRQRRFKGTLFYSLALVKAMLTYSNSHASIEADGSEFFEGPISMIAVTNGPCHGGGFWICPTAQIDDGRLDLVFADAMGPARMIALAARVLRGAHVGHSAVTFSNAREVAVELDPPLPAHVDGELLGAAVRRIEVTIAGKLSVVA